MDFSGVSVDFTPIYGLAVTIATALVGLIAVRKGLKLSNRGNV